MTTQKTGLYPTGRPQDGAAIVAAADTVDLTAVRKRFDTFAQMQQVYTGAHGTVQAVVTELREGEPVLTQLDLALNEGLEELACRLALDGQPRANPFAAYGMDTPYTLMQLNYGEKAKAIHMLTGMVQADTTLSAPTHHVAQAAEDTARQMETELIPFEKLQTSLRTARAARDEAAKQWDNALKALKLDAQAADIEGAPGLEKALLGHLKRSKRRQTTDNGQQTTDNTQQTTDNKQPATDTAATPVSAPPALPSA